MYAPIPLVWLGIAFCLSQSAMFSGLNLALLGISRLSLEAEAQAGGRDAARVLALRQDTNFLLTTVLWGNVSVNCLLTLLSDSVLTGVGAFVFSTVGITVVGEILPQAYFSRNALRVGAFLAPFLRVYQKLLFPVAKPTAWLLDRWLGEEAIGYLRERDLREIIHMHTHAGETEMSHVEGTGALNFLALDDLPISREGEPADAKSIIELPLAGGRPELPRFERSRDDPFLRRVHESGRRWVILTDPAGEPQLVLDADRFLRSVFCGPKLPEGRAHCHRPIVVRDPQTKLGNVIRHLHVRAEHPEDDVIDEDVILLWSPQEKRILTGSDLLGRLLRGIVPREEAAR